MRRLAPLLALAALLTACGTSFVPMYPSEPLISPRGGEVVMGVRRIWITDDVLSSGVGEDTALVVELAIANPGTKPVNVGGASFSCFLVLDSQHPEDTLSLSPVGGAEGDFPGEVPSEGSLLAPMAIPPGERKSYWALFRGYRYPDSDVPRRVTVRLTSSSGDGRTVDLDIADPGRGRAKWEVVPPRSGWAIGILNTSLFGDHLRGMAAGTELARSMRMGPLLWDVGLVSALLIQTKGSLTSATSSFGVSGFTSTLTAPVLGWGTPQEPRQLGLYGGGEALLVAEVQPPAPSGTMPPKPSLYGALAVDVGVELDIGAIRLAGGPFPLTPTRRSMPRWAWRVGYTHWRVNGGGADGYSGGIRFAW
jgi:hypothetical protein